MRARPPSILQSKFFYVGTIFAVSFGLVNLMWRFKTVNWILIVFGLAWMLLVTAFAWEIVTRAQRLDQTVKVRTEALAESNRHLGALLEQLSAFHKISYEINQRIELTLIAETFADRLCRTLSGVEAVWLWLDPGLLTDEESAPAAGGGAPRALALAAQAGRNFGMPEELNPLSPGNPLMTRCFDGHGVALDHNLRSKAKAWGWGWLADPRVSSFVGFPLHLGESLLGVLGVFTRSTIPAEFVSQLQLSVNQLTVALEKGRLLRESRHRAEELAAANEELRQLDAMKDWFVSSVSHELRTPLTNIRSFGEILENYEDLTPPERREFASVIRQESERLSEMINDMLDLAKIADGEVLLKPDYIDLTPLIVRSCKPFSQEADERQIELSRTVPGDLPRVFADVKAVARILNNLVGNAFKFTPDGGAITVAAEPGADGAEHVTVTVSDTGVGIRPRDLPRIFERFTQAGSRLTAKPSGTGIGLAISRELVELSGGEIWVRSRPGEGSTFGFTLPVGRPGR